MNYICQYFMKLFHLIQYILKHFKIIKCSTFSGDLATTFNYSDVNTTFNATIDAETGGGVSRGTCK